MLKKTLSSVLTSLRFGTKNNPKQFDILVKPFNLQRLQKSVSDNTYAALAIDILGSIDANTAAFTAAGVPEIKIQTLKQTCTDFIETYKLQNNEAGRIYLVSEENQAELNAIYDEAKHISLIAQDLYRKDKDKQKLFTFSKLAKKYKGKTRSKKTLALIESKTETESEIANYKMIG